MGKLYLDENDRVQFDPTKDGWFARRAAVGCCLLRLAGTTEQLILASARVRTLTDCADPGAGISGLRDVTAVRQSITSRARIRRIGLI